jgi:hypothetical protein
MKILCLLVALANIFLFMWEYRNGAFVEPKTNAGQTAIIEKEQIILLQELKKEPQPLLPKPPPQMHLDSVKPKANTHITQAHQTDLETTPKTNPMAYDDNQLP